MMMMLNSCNRPERKLFRRRHALSPGRVLCGMVVLVVAGACSWGAEPVAERGSRGAWSVERLGVVLRAWAEPAILDAPDDDVGVSIEVANRSSIEEVLLGANEPGGCDFASIRVKNEETGEYPPLAGRGRVWCNPLRRASATGRQFFAGRRPHRLNPGDAPYRTAAMSLRENFAIREPGLYSVAVVVSLRGPVRSAVVHVPAVHFRVVCPLPEDDTRKTSSQRNAFFEAIDDQTSWGQPWVAEVGTFPTEVASELRERDWQRLECEAECKATLSLVPDPEGSTDVRLFYLLRNSSREAFAAEWASEGNFRLWDIRWVSPSGKEVDYNRDVRTYWRRREDIDWWYDPVSPYEEKRYALRLLGPWREIGEYKLFIGRRIFRAGNVNLNVRPEAAPEPETLGCWLTFRNEKILPQKDE